MPLLTLWLACTPTAPDSPAPTPIEDTAPDVPRGALQFPFPLLERELFELRIGVDHDPVVQEDGIQELICTDFDGLGFPNCYDEHDGSDFIMEGSFETMDAGSATILAAADGVVVYAEDGHYDRCHGDLSSGEVSCDGNDGVANAVIVQHPGGYRTLYWHMKQGSVAVSVGQHVQTGDVLGLVGSSGNSTLPHLHFELQSPQGETIDPYAGPYSQPETWWCDQGEHNDLPGDCG